MDADCGCGAAFRLAIRLNACHSIYSIWIELRCRRALGKCKSPDARRRRRASPAGALGDPVICAAPPLAISDSAAAAAAAALFSIICVVRSASSSRLSAAARAFDLPINYARSFEQQLLHRSSIITPHSHHVASFRPVSSRPVPFEVRSARTHTLTHTHKHKQWMRCSALRSGARFLSRVYEYRVEYVCGYALLESSHRFGSPLRSAQRGAACRPPPRAASRTIPSDPIRSDPSLVCAH